MKRIKYFLFILLIGIVGVLKVNAAGISVKANSTVPTVGSTVKVTVNVNGSGTEAGKVGAWEYCVSYDSKMLTLTSPSSSCVLDGVAGFSSTSTTFTFKVNAKGSSVVTLKNVALYDFDTEAKVNGTIGSVTINAKSQSDISNQTVTKSKNAYLKSLEVVGYELTPAFKKDVKSYELTVANDVKEVGINAFKEDNYSVIRTNVRDIDHIALSEGVNKVVITVTAQAGNKEEYVVNIKKEEENPLTVKVNGKDYAVMKSFDSIDVPKYYSESTEEIEEQIVPVLESEVTGIKLILLKDEEGNLNLYYEENGTYKEYIEIADEVLTLIPVKEVSALKGYEQSKDIKINGNDVKAYYADANSDFVLIYAMNVANGENSWYTYDIKEGTLQRYVEKKETTVKETDNTYVYLTFGFAFVAGVALIIVFIVMGMNSKLKDKNDIILDKLRQKKTVKVVEHPSFDKTKEVEIVENDEENDDLEDTITDAEEEEFFSRDEEDTMFKINRDIEIKPVEEEKKPRRKSRAEKKAEEEELKAMRDDFLRTRELEITKEIKVPKTRKTVSKKKKK